MTYEVSDEIRAFLREKQYLQNISPQTIILYESSFKAFHGAIENLEAVKNRVIALRARGVQPVTVNTYLRHIKIFFDWKKMEWKIPKLKEEQKILSAFPASAVDKFIHYKPKHFGQQRLHIAICLLFDTGLRISEALGIKTADINFDQMTIAVLGKGNKHRLVPFSAEMRKLLFRHVTRLGLKERQFVFATKTGIPTTVRNFQRDFKELAELLHIDKVRISPHTARHTFAVNYLKKGGNLEYLRRILGHNSILTTQRYLKSLGAEDLTAVHSEFSLLSR